MKNNSEKKRKFFLRKLRQPEKPKRIDGQYLFREIADVFCAKRGLLYTIKKMFISPGKSVRHYLEEDRKPYVRPIVFVILTSLIYALVDLFLPVGFSAFLSDDKLIFINPFFISIIDGGNNAVLEWIANASAYTTLLVGLFIAFFVKLFFRKSEYNFFEIFVLLCYVSGISMLFLAVNAIISNFIPVIGAGNSQIISYIYLVWAVGQFFNDKQYSVVKKTMLYIKASLSLLLGGILFTILIMVVTILLGTSPLLEVLRYIWS